MSLRRHTNYTITSARSGTLAEQEQLATLNGLILLTRPEPAGLVIGRFGGGTSYTTSAISGVKISGSYNKLLLLELRA